MIEITIMGLQKKDPTSGLTKKGNLLLEIMYTFSFNHFCESGMEKSGLRR